ncbi:MAG: isopentenyl phosphate kinase, partial [Patescibacteria group bacterium]
KTKNDSVNFAETQRLQNKLNCIVTEELIKKGLPAFPFQASSSAIMKNGRLIKMDLDVIKGLIKLGVIPVLYGVPAYDKEKGCSILSGDQIAPYLAKNLKIKRIIMAGDTDGVFTANPKKDKNAKQIKIISRKNFKEVKKMIEGSSFIDVTGGMAGKVVELINGAREGISAQIINGTKKNSIKNALSGKTIGTIIKW